MVVVQNPSFEVTQSCPKPETCRGFVSSALDAKESRPKSNQIISTRNFSCPEDITFSPNTVLKLTSGVVVSYSRGASGEDNNSISVAADAMRNSRYETAM